MLCLLVSSSFVLSGCRDTDYDLSNIDGLLGFGGDSITLPGNNSTDSIKLDDVLKLDNSDFVKIMSDGTYAFTKADANIPAAHPYISQVAVTSKQYTEKPYNVFGTSSAKRRNVIRRESGTTVSHTFSGPILSLHYIYKDVPTEIEDLEEATVNARYVITIKFADEIKNNIPIFKTLGITLPQYLEIASVTKDGSPLTLTNNSVTLTNVPTSGSITFDVAIKGLDFKVKPTTENKLIFSRSERLVDFSGNVDVNGSFDMDLSKSTTINKNICNINSVMELSDCTLTGATGKFSPSIQFRNLGNVTLNNVPEFLTDKDVKIDLYNPQVDVTFTSDMNVTGLVDGVLVAKYEGRTDSVIVDVPQFTVKPNATTKVCICRDPSKVTGNYDQKLQVSNLSDIIKVIPKTITFYARAKADASVTSTIELGKRYTIQPSYSMYAPLSFADDACIVYRDTLNDWHSDVKDVCLSDGGYIKMTCNAVNQVPVYLTLSAYAIDLNGKEISSSEVEITVDRTIDASPDGIQAVTTPVTLKIMPKNQTVFKKLDGIVIKAVGASYASGKSPVSGVAINAYNQRLVLKNINVGLVGKVIYDLN